MITGGSLRARPRLVVCMGVLAVGAIGVATGLIPINGGRSAEDADLATAACLTSVQAQHGRNWTFSDDVKVNGGDGADAIVVGTAVHINESLAVACNAHNEGNKVWRVTSIRTSAAGS